jgi:hypothetical protein
MAERFFKATAYTGQRPLRAATPPKAKYRVGALAKYARLVSSAAQGAVVRP